MSDPFPTPRGARSPDGVTPAVPRMSSFEEARARHCDSVADLNAEHDRGMTCDGWQAMYDRRGLLLTLDATRAELAEARAAAPPDIDVLLRAAELVEFNDGPESASAYLRARAAALVREAGQ